MELPGLALFFYIFMRMSGFILFNPVFARSNVPGPVRGALSMLLALTAYAYYEGEAAEPTTVVGLAVTLLAEMGIGVVLSLLMRLFFVIPEQAGEILDTQMGLSMARTYDPGSQSNMTMTANILNILMLSLFFALSGHMTLLNIVLTSGDIIPFGGADLLRPYDIVEGFGDITLMQAAALRALKLFAEYVMLAMKMSFPILGAELMGQVGMGVLMKAIPQINVFAINIELKVVVGLVMLIFLLPMMGAFLQEAEKIMLVDIEETLRMAAASPLG